LSSKIHPTESVIWKITSPLFERSNLHLRWQSSRVLHHCHKNHCHKNHVTPDLHCT